MVYFVSTAHVATKSGGTVTVFRHGPSGEKLEIPCPPLLDDYVKYMTEETNSSPYTMVVVAQKSGGEEFSFIC